MDMIKKYQQFAIFVESLKRADNAALIESIQAGIHTVMKSDTTYGTHLEASQIRSGLNSLLEAFDDYDEEDTFGEDDAYSKQSKLGLDETDDEDDLDETDEEGEETDSTTVDTDISEPESAALKKAMRLSDSISSKDVNEWARHAYNANPEEFSTILKGGGSNNDRAHVWASIARIIKIKSWNWGITPDALWDRITTNDSFLTELGKSLEKWNPNTDRAAQFESFLAKQIQFLILEANRVKKEANATEQRVGSDRLGTDSDNADDVTKSIDTLQGDDDDIAEYSTSGRPMREDEAAARRYKDDSEDAREAKYIEIYNRLLEKAKTDQGLNDNELAIFKQYLDTNLGKGRGVRAGDDTSKSEKVSDELKADALAYMNATGKGKNGEPPKPRLPINFDDLQTDAYKEYKRNITNRANRQGEYIQAAKDAGDDERVAELTPKYEQLKKLQAEIISLFSKLGNSAHAMAKKTGSNIVPGKVAEKMFASPATAELKSEFEKAQKIKESPRNIKQVPGAIHNMMRSSRPDGSSISLDQARSNYNKALANAKVAQAKGEDMTQYANAFQKAKQVLNRIKAEHDEDVDADEVHAGI